VISIGANLSTVFRDLPWSARFDAAREAGFDGVEIQFPYSEPAEELARRARAAGLPIALINGPVDSAAHPFGIAALAEMQSSFRAQMPRVLDYALALGVRHVHILAGRLACAGDRASCVRTYTENLSFAAERLGAHGIGVLIEPLNQHDAPGYLLDSFDLAAQVLTSCAPGVGLQFDVYHASRMGLDPLVQIARSLPLIRHLQIADAPGRHQPGTGAVRFRPLIERLIDAGYAGWVGAEYFPLGGAAQSSVWLAQWREWMHRRTAPGAEQSVCR
jgi:hydroxypyruvate isomerase